ncbi:type II secretion system F family protein [Helcobacillus massiliensis]|uniref:type II secretion system F family protein n=1 Tax=Helcobacillus massiliensis TaxID=521392 RepID=UPI0029558370|nr:type II secretion system F family protein [Helcobacillus massiliensis]WOO93524.1 type II secretion system F family protein [Helcobacillus massiliensis]
MAVKGIILGAVLGMGALLIFMSAWEDERSPKRRARSRAAQRLSDDLTRIGLLRVEPIHLAAVSVLLAGLVFLIALGATTAMVPSIAAGALALTAPIAIVRMLAQKRRDSLKDVWPDLIEHVNSAVRAGMSLPEALAQLAEHGPEPLRDSFSDFARDYQATGDFGHCLDRLKMRLADPVGDRIVEALRITRDVGGTDLGALLRTLAQFLRDDARVRSELEARQSWTVNGARLALVAPWAVLAMMVMRPEAAEAYDTPAGAALIAGGAVVSIAAYRLMVRIGRLPHNQRTLA